MPCSALIDPQLEHRAGDHAERAFRTDEQLLQVVAGIVLAQPAQAAKHAAVGEHDFQPEREVARIAIAQHVHPAGIGRQVAADLAAAFRAQRQREQPARRGGGLLHRGQHATGLDGDRVVQRVEREHAVHARERQHDRAAVHRRGRAAAHAGVAALSDHRGAGLGAGAYHRRDFRRAAGTHQRQRAAVVEAAPVAQRRGDVGRVGEHVRAADRLREPLDQRRGRRGVHPGRVIHRAPARHARRSTRPARPSRVRPIRRRSRRASARGSARPSEVRCPVPWLPACSVRCP